MSDLPVLGCAMELHNLEKMAPWVLEKDRDLEIQDGYHAFVLDKTADKVADRVKEILGSSYKGRLGLHGPFYGFDLDSVDPAIRKVVRMRLEQALRMAHRMGATQMVLHSPLTLWDRDNMLHQGYEAGKIGLVQDSIGDAVKMAEDMGITIVLENIQDIDPTWRVRLIETLGSDRVRTSIDMQATCSNTFTCKTPTAPQIDTGALVKANSPGFPFSRRSASSPATRV